MIDTRVITTDQMLGIWAEGRQHHLRDVLADTMLPELDKEGWHVLIMETWGANRIGDGSVPLHHSVSAVLKIAASNRPFCARVGVTDTTWAKLETWDHWHDRMRDEQAQIQQMARTTVSAEVFDEIEASLAEPAGPSPKLKEAAARAVDVIERKDDDDGEWLTGATTSEEDGG